MTSSDTVREPGKASILVSLASRWSRFWFEPTTVDPGATLGVVRVVICLGALWVIISQNVNLLEASISRPPFYFYYPPVWYLKLLHIRHSMPAVEYISFFGAIIFLLFAAAGFHFRWSLGIAIACLFYLNGARDGYAATQHHRMIAWAHALIILACSRAGDVCSLDARRRRWRSGGQRELSPWEATWPVRLIQVSLVLFYFSTGVAKIRVAGPGWLMDGTAVQRVLLQRWASEPQALGASLMLALSPTICWLLSAGTVVMELLSPLLLSKRLIPRIALCVMLSTFHIGNYFLAQIPFHQMPVLFVVFFDFTPLLRWVNTRGAPSPGSTRV